VAVTSSRPNALFLRRMTNNIGGEFKRESWICRGDAVCDWDFVRHKIQD
jgi:hypothetical protein